MDSEQLRQNFPILVYMFDKRLDSKGYVEKMLQLKRLRTGKSSSAQANGEIKDLEDFDEKQTRLLLQLYSYPQKKYLNDVVKSATLEKNLDQLNKLGRKSKYFQLIKGTVFSSLGLGMNSMHDSMNKTTLALKDTETLIFELKPKYNMLLAKDKERLSSLIELQKELTELVSFFRKELQISKEYRKEIEKEIERIK